MDELDDLKFLEREEIYEPLDNNTLKSFTPGKAYKIINEIMPSSLGSPVLYIVQDDNGEIRRIPHNYFALGFKESSSIQKLITEDPCVINVRDEHEKLEQLYSSGMPELVWEWYDKLKEMEEWKSLAGVKQRKKVSLVALDHIEDKITILLEAAQDIAHELASMRFELNARKGEDE